MPIAADMLGGWIVKGTVTKVNRYGLEQEVQKIISPRAYQSRDAAEEFCKLARKQGVKDAFVTESNGER